MLGDFFEWRVLFKNIKWFKDYIICFFTPAEAVLESLKGHPEAEARVKEVRDQTKAEKKKLAMAMRAKQLKAFGLKANDQGQVKAADSLLQQFVDLAEESGLCCNICREGYKFQPNKVLAIYTYTRPCSVDEGEVSPPGLPGTVVVI